jgi:hypothetical protein
MTTFTDGPAKGQKLMLHRVCVFLRVVRGADGKWDALDQLVDEPKAEEKLYAYTIVGQPSMMHLNCGRNSRSGFYACADYRLVEPQPSDEDMRSNGRWTKWCYANAPVK